MDQHKVLLIAHTSVGGSAFNLFHLARGLSGSQYKSVVLFYARQHSHVEDMLDKSDIDTVILDEGPSQTAKTSAEVAGRRDIAAWLEARLGQRAGRAYSLLKECYNFLRQDAPRIRPIIRAISANQIDLVFVNNGLRRSKAGIVAAWVTRTPCVCHVQMLRELNGFDRAFARLVDIYVFLSTALAESYETQRVRMAQSIVVPSAVELDDYSQEYDGELVRQEFGWPPTERLVGVVGRLDWWKGHEYFVEAIAEAVRRIPNLRGMIVGAPVDTPENRDYHAKLRSLANSLDLEEVILFTGFRSDVPRLMAAMDVVVLSSSTPEPFGRVVIEGMAAGKPVVATAAGGVLDIIEDGVSGLLVPPQDSHAMATAIIGLLSNSEEARRIGLAARRRVEEKFTLEHHVRVMRGVFDSVLAARARGGGAAIDGEARTRGSRGDERPEIEG